MKDLNSQRQTAERIATYVRDDLAGDLAGDRVQSCPELELLAHAMLNPAEGDGDSLARADEHLRTCAECRVTLLSQLAADAALRALSSEDGFEVDEVPTALGSRVEPGASSAARLPRAPSSWRVAGAGIMAAAAAVVLTLWTTSLPPAPMQTGSERDGDSTLTAKGAEATLHIGVKRGDTSFELGSSERARPGDRLGFFYTSASPTYLEVLAVDARGEVTKLYPAMDLPGGRQAPLAAGRRVRLPDGATVTASDGCEWIVGVFASAPLSEADIRARLARAAQAADPGTCHLALDLPRSSALTIQQVSP